MPPSAPNPHSAGEFGQLGREVCRQQAPPEPQKLQRAWYLKLSRPQERPQHGWLRLLTGCHGGSGGEGGSGVDMDGRSGAQRTLDVRTQIVSDPSPVTAKRTARAFTTMAFCWILE